MTEHYTDKGHLLIRNSDIKDGYFEFGENPIYLDEEFSEQNKSRMHQLGDVITVHTGDIGTSAVIGENEVNSIGFATIVTRPNQEILDSNYFATYLNTDTHKQWAISMATGDGRSNYNLKDYTKLVVPIPEIEEQKKKQLKNSLHTLMPSKLVPVFIARCGISPEKAMHQITREERQRMVELLKDFRFTLAGARPLEEAIVTAGGVSVKEISPKTMESKLVKGLYFTGEVLDIDGMTGGFNLQAAFSTGYLAGIACTNDHSALK